MAAMDQATCQTPAELLRITRTRICNNNTAHVAKTCKGTHPDAQEHVDSVGAGHVTDGGVGVLILDGGHLTGKSICIDKEAKAGISGYFLESPWR